MSKRAMIHLGVNAGQALEKVGQTGAAILANYGQSVLVRAEEPDLQRLGALGFRVRELPDAQALEVGGFHVDTARREMRSTNASARKMAAPGGASHHILTLAGPMHADWKKALERLGTVFHQALSEASHLVTIPSAEVDDVQALVFVESVAPYSAPLKVNPALLTASVGRALKVPAALALAVEHAPEPAARPRRSRSSEIGNEPESATPVAGPETAGNLELVLFRAADLVAVADAARKLKAKIIRAEGDRLIVFAGMALVPKLAAIPQVREINPYAPPRLHNNVASGIMRTDVLQNTHGLDGSGQIVAVADTGLDTGVNDATMLDDFEGRIVALFGLGRPGDPSDPNSHGTHVAGSVLGNGANSNGTIRGSAPAAQLVFQSIMSANGTLGGIPNDLGVGLFDVARDQGARIHTNSWGAPVNGAYNANASEADAFAFNNREFLICFSAGNEGRNAQNRVGSPGTAKNVLTIGASESLRALPASVNFPASPSFPAGATLPNVSTEADNQNDVAVFSSIGPAQNNRRKPDVVAPGTWILSTRSSIAVKDNGPDGLANTGDEDGVATHPEAVGLGLPGQPIRFAGDANAPAAPAGAGAGATQNYMYQSGTSMATPLTAGACALVRQHLVQQRGHTPSAALMKAIVINGAVDMGGGVPANGQGWGRVDFNNTLFPAGTRRTQFDDSLDSAAATGDIRTYDIFVSSAAQPLAVTLAWRDPAGNTIQNRLHLRVTHVATAATSSSDAIGNILNNVQKVIVSGPATGLWRIEVEGVSVATGIPEWLPALRQDFALVVSNATGFSCNPSDIVQVLDKSGSMGFSGYMEPAKERARQLIDLLQINDKAGVVTFASAAAEIFPLTLIDDQSVKDDAHAAIAPVNASGTTDLREGLERGVTSLGADAGRPRAIVFLSDGKHTVATPAIDDPLLASIATANIKVHTIALGPDTDFTVLNNIANLTGTGAVHNVESAADLHKLHEIYYSIIGGAGCGGVVHLDSTTVTETLAQTVPIDGTSREAHFALSWHEPGAEFDFSLTDPAGQIFNSAATNAFFLRGSTHAFYRVSWPRQGNWKMNVRVRKNPSAAPLKVTTAVLADSDFHCRVRLDRKFLFQGKMLIEIAVTLDGKKPVPGGKAVADVTFPTLSIAALLKKHADALKKLKADRLGRDKPDANLIKLGLFAAQQAALGKDIFARKTVRVDLRDDGKAPDAKAKDGVYAGFFDAGAAKVAGNFHVKVFFDIEHPKFGPHRCVELLPVFVPAVAR